MDIFVSYSTPDRDRVAPIVEALKREGWSVWWDRNIEAGTVFDREIQGALEAAKCVLVVWTESSVESDWVLDEANDGLERGILVPILLDSVRPPLQFRRIQAVQRPDIIEAVTRQLQGTSIRTRLNLLTVAPTTIDSSIDSTDAQNNRIPRIVRTFRGSLYKEANGASLFQFPSVIGSVRAALELRKTLTTAVRMGVHCGDHVSDKKQPDESVATGTGLASLADAGGICLSDEVFQGVRRRLELAPKDLGEQKLTGRSEPIHVYNVGNTVMSQIVAMSARQQVKQPQDVPTLAVLSFRNMNADPEFEYFGDGIAMDVVEELLRIPRLQVVSTMSSFTYKMSSASAIDIGHELGARHVLEGSVRQVGGQVRITAQLSDTVDGQVKWADHYDRKIDDIFAVQDEITREITKAMDVKFYIGESASVVYKHIRSSAAKQQFYRAWELANRLNKADSERAKACLQEAILIEPESPLLYSMLAWVHYLEKERGWAVSERESENLIRRLVDEALMRDDTSGIGPMLVGYLSLLENDHEKALVLSKTAIDERPSCPVAFSMRAGILNYAGKPEEALEPAKHAIRISPVVQPVYPEVLSFAYYLDGQIDAALESANETLSYAPDSVASRVVLIAALVESGRVEVARDVAVDILSLDPTFALNRYESTHPFRDRGTLKRITSSLRAAGLKDVPNTSSRYGIAPESRRRVALQRKR